MIIFFHMSLDNFLLLIIKDRAKIIHSNYEPFIFTELVEAIFIFASLEFSTIVFLLDKCIIFYCLETRAIILISGKKDFNPNKFLNHSHNLLYSSKLQKEYSSNASIENDKDIKPIEVEKFNELYKGVKQKLSEYIDHPKKLS